MVNITDKTGKSIIKSLNGGAQVGKVPQFMFAAIPSSLEGPGVIDVISLRSGFQRFDTDPHMPGIQSIPAPGAQVVVDYFRQ